MWLWGTIIPTIAFVYILIARFMYRYGVGKWGNPYDLDTMPEAMFGVFWPVTLPVYLALKFTICPAFGLFDGMADAIEAKARARREE